MKPATRLGTSVTSITSVGHKSAVARGFICLQCRHRSALAAQRGALPTSIPISLQRHASSASQFDSLTRKIRRKIWGTDNPPGQEDPYGGPSQFELVESKVKKDPVAAAEKAPGEDVDPSDTAAINYVPATTWDGLDQIGGATGWWEEAWDRKHPFRGYVLRQVWQSSSILTSSRDSFMEPSKMTSRDEIEAAVRRALIEVFTLRDAERPLTDAVNATNAQVTPNLEIVAFTESGDGSVVLNFPNPDLMQEILDSMDLSWKGPTPEVSGMQPTDEVSEMEDVVEVTKGEVVTKLEATAAGPDRTMAGAEESLTPDSTTEEGLWQNVSLCDTGVKFAVHTLECNYISFN